MKEKIGSIINPILNVLSATPRKGEVDHPAKTASGSCRSTRFRVGLALGGNKSQHLPQTNHPDQLMLAEDATSATLNRFAPPSAGPAHKAID
jgi:hypothetical protein